MTNKTTSAIDLVDKLERFVAMPEWPRFYMDKEQGALCVKALRAMVEALRSSVGGE